MASNSCKCSSNCNITTYNLVQNDYADSMSFMINYGLSKSCLLEGELICIPIVNVIAAIDTVW